MLNPSELNAPEVDREPGTASGCECVCVMLRRAGSSTQDETRNRHHWMDGLMDGWMRGGGINRGSMTSLTLSTEAALCAEVQLLYHPGNRDHHHGDEGCLRSERTH